MNVVGYIRVSTQGQAIDGYRLKYQEDEIKAYCKERGLNLIHIFRDEGISGAKLNEEALEIDRVGLQEMLAHLSSVQIDYVVVLNTSRLWRSDIVKVLIKKERRGRNMKIVEKIKRKLNLPTNENKLSGFRKSVVEKFGEDILPQQYYEFLQTVNGIEFNGLKIYGIDQNFLDSKPINHVDSFFDANETWGSIKGEDELIFFGDSDIAWYCYNVSKKSFVELDKPSGDYVGTFCDFDAMLESALCAALS